MSSYNLLFKIQGNINRIKYISFDFIILLITEVIRNIHFVPAAHFYNKRRKKTFFPFTARKLLQNITFKTQKLAPANYYAPHGRITFGN